MKRILTLALIFSTSFVFAQTDSTQARQKSQFKLSLNYNSGLNYYGRTDSLKSTAFFPQAELWFTKDVYISAAPVFVHNNVQSMAYAGTVSTLGYLHVTDKWITSLYVLKPFYTKESKLVQSALQAQTGASLTHLSKTLNLTGGLDLKFSDKVDLGATLGLDHIIRKELANNSVLVIDPSFYLYGGTQNFSNTYNKKRSGFLLLPGTTEQVTQSVKQFNLLAYEFSLPVIFSKDKWMVLLTPSYILPQNLVSVPGHPELSEQGENTFYTTLSLKRTF
jgi:hypothetical protein